jgi:hypothetical protein
MKKREIADLIERFLDGDASPREWDDFESVRLEDPELDAIRVECAEVRRNHPAERSDRFCSEEGASVLRAIAGRIRRESEGR